MAVAPLSLANVQGDILFGLPKQSQSFFFFQIDQADAFRSDLTKLVPLITSAEQTSSNISEIRQVKLNSNLQFDAGDGEAVHPDVITVSGVNIAFSARGLQKINITDNIQDPSFTGGMKANAQFLGDSVTKQADGTFQPDWDATFMQELHGVALITGDSRDTVAQKLASVKQILSSSVNEITTMSGDVRPGDLAGHEHFGYKDGISNPAVNGVDAINPGQFTIDQGVALLGRGNDLSINRPSWALDGSFLVFRKMPQLVPEFDKFLLDTAKTQEGADLLGARIFGRWKSGAPVVLSPTKDDPALGADPHRNNNFTFTPGDQSACPFSTHIRKANPRGELPADFLEKHMILRRSIPFGPEVSDQEQQSGATTQERGLLFVCYQSAIAEGFSFIQSNWANNPNFPPDQANLDVAFPGLDPIIGQANGTARAIEGAFANNTLQELTLPIQWVNNKGGEYFFSPSIPTLKNVFAKA